MTKTCTVRECLTRSIRTFGQAAAGYIVANAAAILMGAVEANMLKSALIGLGVSAVAAGLAALMNMPKSAASEDKPAIGKDDSAGE